MHDSAPHAPIVVGVDGSEVSLEAVEWAAAEAVARHRRLRVVHAFIWPLLRVPMGPSTYRRIVGCGPMHSALWTKPCNGPGKQPQGSTSPG